MTKGPHLAGLPNRWRRAPRRWGHPLHSVCSYFAMFPPQVPHVFVRWLTRPGDVVYDPFAGRGTAPMEACRLGRVGWGSDANPLATALTSAKVDPPTFDELTQRIDLLRAQYKRPSLTTIPHEIAMLYHRRVLAQLAWLRSRLDPTVRSDRFIRATVLGLLHANYDPGRKPRGLSISMPNTFSMSPNYVRAYIREHDLVPPEVDVFDMVVEKARRLALPGEDATRGKAWPQLAQRAVHRRLRSRRAKLIFTSPPYLSVIKYGKYNWVRLWFLGEDPREVDSRLISTGSPRRYLSFMSDVLGRLSSGLDDDGYACLMIGDVRERDTGETTNLADEVWRHAAQPQGWRKVALITDTIPVEHKVSRIWKNNRGRATKTDRILVLAKSDKACRKLPPLDPIIWSTATNWS